MKLLFTKISILILFLSIFLACNVVKKVPDQKYLLKKNTVYVDGNKNKDEDLSNQIVQKPNSAILGYKLRLNMFNLANEDADSTFKAKYISNPKKYERQSKWLSRKQVNRLGKSFWYSGWHSFLIRTGEPPIIIL